MVTTAASALNFGEERRRLIQVIPERFINFLNEWEVRVFIIVSLMLQIILITLGNRRKYVCRIWIRIILWCAYLLADWVAIVSLGVISKDTIVKCKDQRSTEDPLSQLKWFWAQFLLLHLGGPDTITALSLEDNELWLRHLVAMLIQTGLASYILLVAFPPPSRLPFLSILIFIAGLIKYGERLFALRASTSEHFRDSMLTEPDPGPNYPKFMEEYTLKKAEGFYVEAAEVIETPVPVKPFDPTDSGELILAAYEMLMKFKPLFADAILSFQDRDSSQSYFQNLKPKDAFDVVEVELGFMFDELYTKACIVYNRKGGFVLRLITFSFTLFALMDFIFLCDKSNYKKLDLIITYLLLVVGICLEIYAVSVLITSDWTSIWLSRQDNKSCSAWIIGWFNWRNKKRWSAKMAQHNLLDLCVGERSSAMLLMSNKIIRNIRKIVPIDNYLERYWYKTFVDVSPKLKELIFEVLKSYIANNEDPSPKIHTHPCGCGCGCGCGCECVKMCGENHPEHNAQGVAWVCVKICGENHMIHGASGGGVAWRRSHPSSLWNRKGSFTRKNSDFLDWTNEREFDQRILLWHIATDICYSQDNEYQNCKERKEISIATDICYSQDNEDQKCKERKEISKCISDYMLYLLIACPFMLPIGIGMMRFRDTCAEAKEFLEERNVKSGKGVACRKLLEVNTQVPPIKVKGDRSKSVLFDACKLVKDLPRGRGNRWELISQIWVEMLAHAATHCGGNHHARQLRKGGELLTHVWLLMAHLGITEQFQISQGHARAKLVAK